MIASLREVIAEGRKRNIAIGSFNTTNSESLIAVLNAAERLNVPVIIMHAQCHENVAPIEKIGRMMVEMAKASKTKVCVHLDHGEDFDYCKKAMDIGFRSVMIDNSAEPYDRNVELTHKVVYHAHVRGVDVEAELGSLPAREGGVPNADPVKVKPEDLYTIPALVPDFIQKTNVDALAIAFGTAHGIYKVKPVLNMDIITEIRKLTNIPLVMHGGSGISDEQYREVIKRGINKINYYTYMSYAGYSAAKAMTDETDAAYCHELSYRAQEAMEENVYKTLKVFSCID